MSFMLFIVKLSQWIKLSPNDIIAKMFLLSLVSLDCDIICKYVPNTKKMNGLNTSRTTFEYFKSEEFCAPSGRCKLLTRLLTILPLCSIAFFSSPRKRAIAVRFHMYCSIIQAINAN